jgi:hypothetical protein
MPKAATLPESLKNFAFLNAAPIDVGRDFHPHVGRLIQSIDEVLARKSGGAIRAAPKSATGQAAAPAAPPRAMSRMLIVVSVMVLLLAGGATAWWSVIRGSVGGVSIPAGTMTALPAGSAASPDQNATTQAADDLQWVQLKNSKDVALLRGFVEQYPDSKHRAEAERRLLGLILPSGSSVSLDPGDRAASSTPDINDEGDWTQARNADTFDAYQTYLKAHPQGAHVADAKQAAAEVRPIANALKQEPGIGVLLPGHTAIVDDRDPMCKRGEVKVVTGGDVTKIPIVYRTKKCVPRDQLP